MPPSDLGPKPEVEDWHERAVRLQAEMDNYRKRQQRLAGDQVETERQRLLLGLIRIVDNLERALAAPVGDGQGLRTGIQLTHQAALQLLSQEGVEPIQAEQQPFDPAWHEAVGVVQRDCIHFAPNTVSQVLDRGYRLGDRLLRPARVMVSVA